MKHRLRFRKLGRSPSHRAAMLKTMVTQLIRHERIETTVEKAKELRKVADRVITYGKKGSDESRKRASEFVRGDDELFKVFTELAQRYKFRDGGYTRILRSRIRANDSAKLAYIEFIDREGELRPARTPQYSLLPPSANALLEPPKEEEEKDKEPEPPKSKGFFGWF